MKYFRLLSGIISVTILVSLLSSCSGGGSDSTGPGTPDDTWETGRSATYQLITNTTVTVEDSLTGCSFVIPGGSSTTVTVTEIVSGVSLPWSATVFNLEVEGGNDITIQVPDAGSHVMFRYGDLQGAAIDDRSGITDWWGVPPTSTEENETLYRVMIDDNGAGKASAYTEPSRNTFAVANIPSGSGDGLKMAAVRTSVAQCIEIWLTNLPASLQSSARQAVADLPYTITWTNSGNAYKHGDSMIFSNAVFYFSVDANLEAISHEVGHYMTHALLGYDRYEEIYRRFPTDFWGGAVAHDIGMFRAGRRDLLEDYAYISQIMITGHVSNYDLTSVARINNVRDLVDKVQPDSKDYPSHEGYGAAILASLLRSDDEVYTFSTLKSWEKAKVPVVGASISDVLGILARGPRDVNEARAYIQDYLDDRGNSQRYKLSAMMEPIGWSYNGFGRILDSKGDPVAGAHAVSVSQDGDYEYRTPLSTPSGDDGKFWLMRIYPGQSIVRIFYNADKDSLDFPLTVDWNKPTDDAVELGDYKIERGDKTTPLELAVYNVLTPGIRAQNPLNVECAGTLKTSEGVNFFINKGDVIDIQSTAGVNDEMSIQLDIEYVLTNGTSWETHLQTNDVPGAVRSVTTLSNARLRIIGAYGTGQDSDEVDDVLIQSATRLDLTITPATISGQYYRGDIRLEWDYDQVYYDKDGGEVKTDSGQTGVYLVHIWRDVPYVWW